jgi:hypothetical protein
MRKQTAKQKILNALETKSMKPKDVAIATKLNIKTVYAILYKLHSVGDIIKGDDGAYVIQRVQLKDGHMEKLTSSTIKKFKDTIEEQRAELAKYHEWCLEWKKMIRDAEDKEKEDKNFITRLCALVNYLEGRVTELTIEVHNLSQE